MILKKSLTFWSNLISFRKLNSSSINLCKKAISGEFQDFSLIKEKKNEFFQDLNKLIDETRNNRNFAVIHLYGHQYFIHEGDVIQIKYDLPVKLGEKIKIEKCLLVGNDSLTLIGRPLLDRNKINIEVSPIEKIQSYTQNKHLITQRQSNKRRWRFHRYPITFVRVNEISIKA